MITSGTTPITTSNDTPVQAVAGQVVGKIMCRQLAITNEGTAAGFFSVDGGATWARFPAAVVAVFDDLAFLGHAVLVKRTPSGSNLSGVYVACW